MGAAIFVGLLLVAVAVAAVVAAFLIHGMLLGLAALLLACRTIWQGLVDREREVALEEATAMAKVHAEEERSTERTEERTEAHCWAFKQCPAAVRDACPAHQRPDIPCWLACMQSNEHSLLKPECLACQLFNLPMLIVQA